MVNIPQPGGGTERPRRGGLGHEGVEWTRTASASAHFTDRTLTHLGQALDHRNLTRALEEVEAELGDDVHLCVKITYGYDC